MILTSSIARGDAKYFSDSGFDAYLTKPVLSQVLHDALVTLLQVTDPDAPIVTQHSVAESKQEQMSVFEGKVLIVEDNKINQLVAKTMFENLGLNIEIAEDGQEALDCFNRKKYDLIFMDCRMPVMDGYEASSAIRSLEKSKDGSRIPIVALTANAMASDSEKCLAAGMDDFLTKPFSSAQLEKMLFKWLK